MSKPLSDRILIAYLEGEVARSQAEEVETAARRTQAVRERLEEYRDLFSRLGDVSPELEATDLVPALREAASRQGNAKPARRRTLARPVGLGAGLALIAAAAIWFFALSAQKTDTSDEFQPKSATAVRDSDRWIGLRAYRVHGDQRPERLGERMSRDDGLLFSYVNAGDHGYRSLMIFAVDVVGGVHWCYPAWIDPDENPSSIEIREGARVPVDLPDLVHQDLPPGPLAIYGLFTAKPLRVSEVEAAVAKLVADTVWDANAHPRLPFADAGQHAFSTLVEP